MMGWQRHRWISVCLLIIGLGAFMLFLYGFFPLKYHSGKLAHMDDLPNFIGGVSIDGHEVYNAGEHSVVLMVIDSLRYDFVSEEYMPFAAELLKNKSACIYVSVAEPPTVTMPRIKAMMTGSVSTFADVALNFGAPAVRGDSVLRVSANRGRRNIMYGDETWLRLFPGLWAEADGTTSFYVTDYTEVDNNVTRHLDKVLTLDEETKSPKFDFLVLHYLGLDHIGHLEGARSPKVKPKLIEMDEVIKKLYNAMKTWERPGVILVCGDHGMRDAGGHGGATPAEVLVPLLLINTHDFSCPHPPGPGPTVEQVDIAPSIAWLLNAPLPGDSVGRVLPALLPRDVRQRLYLLHVVAAHNARETAMPTDAGTCECGPTVERVDVRQRLYLLHVVAAHNARETAMPTDAGTCECGPTVERVDVRQRLYLLHVVAAHNARETAMPTDAGTCECGPTVERVDVRQRLYLLHVVAAHNARETAMPTDAGTCECGPTVERVDVRQRLYLLHVVAAHNARETAMPTDAGTCECGPTVERVDVRQRLYLLHVVAAHNARETAMPTDAGTCECGPTVERVDVRQRLYLLHVVAAHNARETAMPTDAGTCECGPTVERVDVRQRLYLLHVVAAHNARETAMPTDAGTCECGPTVERVDVRQRLYLLHVVAAHNARETAMPTDAEFYKQFERAEKQFAHYLATGQQSAAKIAKEFYEESLEEMAKYLTETTANFDLFSLVVAAILLYVISGALACVTIYSLQTKQRKISSSFHRPSRAGVAIAYLVIGTASVCVLTTACFITETRSQLCSFQPWWFFIFILIALTFAIAYVIVKSAIETTKDLSFLSDLNVIDYLLVGGTLFHAWSFFGTSFIEEEHMTWYFFWNTLMLFVLVRTIVVLLMYLGKVFTRSTEVQEKPELHRKMDTNIALLPQWIALIALHRYLRTMNQTGDRWLFLPDTADWLNEPENAGLLEAHMVVGTLATLFICIRNLKYTNNILQMHTAFTVLSTLCIFAYRTATQSLSLPFEDIKSWDPVTIVTVFWGLIIAQVVFEVLTYVGIFRLCGVTQRSGPSSTKFVYNKPKAKTEDYFYDAMVEEPWNLNEVKLNFVRSMSHLMLNNLMLIIILLMRPHNVVMVPSVYVTCALTAKALDHKLLDTSSGKNKDAADSVSLTLAHLWIGAVFFFYQGNSNSLASVDLGAGYVGLRAYSAARVAARMGLHAYAGPALAGAALFSRLPARADSWERYLQSVWRAANIFSFQRVYSLAIYAVIAIIFRHHLFVWSVFSPKLLYDFVGTVFTIQALSTIVFIVAMAHIASWIAKLLTHKSRL